MKSNNSIKICCIFNTPAHYCKAIYSLIDSEFKCKFVFGDDFPSVKRFDTSILKDSSFLHYRFIKRLLFVPGMLKFAFGHYDYYIINPSTNCVSMWILFALLKLMPSKKVYTWTHGMYGNETKRQLFFKKLQYYMCDGEFVYGDYAIELMKNKGFDPKKLFPIHNSLDYDEQLKLRNSNLLSNIYKEHFGNENPVIVVIGRLNKRKKLPMLLDAVEILKRQGKSINVVFIGDGEERENLVQSAHSKCIDNQVWMYGACYDEKKNAELLYNATVCVMPGDIGLTAIHSLMFGLPVITHDYFPNHGPEFEVVKPGKTGSFFKYNDVDSLAHHIDLWSRSNNDRSEIRNACYQIIDNEWNPNYQISLIKSAFKM